MINHYIRKYNNKNIEKNLKISNVLFIISTVLSCLNLLGNILTHILTKNGIVEVGEIFFYIFILITPLTPLLFETPKRETARRNDYSDTFDKIFFVHIEIIFCIFLTIIFGIISACLDDDSFLFFANYLVYLTPPHIFSYIAAYILIYNCVSIKREWRDNPPEFAKREFAEKKRKREKKELKYAETNYKYLINICGIKFFIKYYKQVKSLPLRDVCITETYSPAEKQERLLALKKIIDLNLVEFALSQILKDYSEILDKKEIEQAKLLLSEL